MWRLYLTAKTFSQRPARLIGLTDAYWAYQFDNAVRLLGVWIENELEKVKPEQRSARLTHLLKYGLLGAPVTAAEAAQDEVITVG